MPWRTARSRSTEMKKRAVSISRLEYSGTVVTVTRKAIKNFYVRVDRETGEVRVTAPRRLEAAEILRFLQRDWPWVEKQRAKAAARPHLPVHHYETGEVFYLWGRPYVLTVRERSARRTAVCTREGKLLLYLDGTMDCEQRQQVLEAWYRARLMQGIEALREEAETIVGRQPREYRIKKMKTRWGTCNAAAGRIWLNLKLAQYRPEILRYIMLHELTHLWVHNHGPAFRARMDRFCPDWRRLKQELDGGPAYEI